MQVLHGSRSAHNLRDTLDVVRFLSHSAEDDVLRHLWNLQYEPRWRKCTHACFMRATRPGLH